MDRNIYFKDDKGDKGFKGWFARLIDNLVKFGDRVQEGVQHFFRRLGIGIKDIFSTGYQTFKKTALDVWGFLKKKAIAFGTAVWELYRGAARGLQKIGASTTSRSLVYKALVTLVVFGLVGWAFFTSPTQEEEVTLATYQQSGIWDYQAYLLPNSLYAEQIINPQ